jgi:hypothetical protein
MARDLRRKGMPGRDGAGDGLEGAEQLRQWILRHRTHWQAACVGLLKQGWRAKDIILLATPYDDTGENPPKHFEMTPWADRESLLRQVPHLRSLLDKPPHDDTCYVLATKKGGRMKGSFVGQLSGAGMPAKLPTVVVSLPREPGDTDPDITVVA